MGTSKTLNGKIGKVFTSEELLVALRNIEDLMDRLLTPYFLLGKTAEAAKFGRFLEGDGIDIGIKSTALTQYVYDILNSELNLSAEQVKDGFEYMVGQVPIRVKVYSRDYYFFKYPDHIVYQYGTYQIANPWDKYWKSRFLIR